MTDHRWGFVEAVEVFEREEITDDAREHTRGARIGFAERIARSFKAIHAEFKLPF